MKVVFLVVLSGIGVAAGQPACRPNAGLCWADYHAGIYAVPRDFVRAIIDVESSWYPYAVSPKGAVGIMQLMPATAVAFGVTNRFQIEQNIRGGVAYLDI